MEKGQQTQLILITLKITNMKRKKEGEGIMEKMKTGENKKTEESTKQCADRRTQPSKKDTRVSGEISFLLLFLMHRPETTIK